MNNIELSEKGITVKIILDSITDMGTRITTFELEYPRFVHSELMTHRVFSRNAASSRAIPVKKLLSRTIKEMAMPIYWGANQSGMQADGQLTGYRLRLAKIVWRYTGYCEVAGSWLMNKIGLHKQIANRPMESHHNIKIVMTSTEWDNWYNLRNHKDAQPEIALVAKLMKKAHNISERKGSYNIIKSGQWHVPYIDTKFTGKSQLFLLNGTYISLKNALKISSSCCAQISYRLLNKSCDKALEIYDKLINSEPRHSSPFEHCAKVPGYNNMSCASLHWESGVTHVDRYGTLWSNNFRSLIQYRALLEQNNYSLSLDKVGE